MRRPFKKKFERNPDPVYQSELLEKFTNYIMFDGKKSTARKVTLALRWLIGAARAKKGKPMAEKLSEELLAASRNEGGAIKKKEDTRRMAEANRAFAHFAW